MENENKIKKKDNFSKLSLDELSVINEFINPETAKIFLKVNKNTKSLYRDNLNNARTLQVERRMAERRGDVNLYNYPGGRH